MRGEKSTYMGGRMVSARRGFSIRNVRWIDLDWHVLLIALALFTVGMLFQRAMALSDFELGHDGIRFESHLKKVVVALPALGLGLLVRPGWLRNRSYLIYGACIFLLLLVPILGEERNHAKRWIPLPFGFDVQPSELAKLGLILVLGRVLERRRLARVEEWVSPALFALLPMGLVAMQPDLGTAITIVPITLGMFYLAGARGTTLTKVVLLVLLTGLCVWRFEIGVRDYQLQRIDTWARSFEPDPLIEGRRGPGFHPYQARVAIGNGGWLGTGLGQGIANETGYLPERSSDSIVAVIGEEVGFIGLAGLLFLYALMIVLLMVSAAGVRDRYARLVVGGIAIYFASHVFINVGVNIGLVPMTGLPLPLFSTGGSSLLATLTALGLALGLSAHYEPHLDRDAFRKF